MPHDATKVLLGSTPSSDRTVTVENGDPDTFKAGYAVRLHDDGTLVIADDTTSSLIGISAGSSLSDITKTAVIRSGLRVPLRLKALTAATLTINGDLTFTAVEGGEPGNAITITMADTGTAGSETVAVTDTDITIAIEAGVSTATQIAAAYNGGSAGAIAARALATIAIVTGQGAAAQAAAAEDNLEGGVGMNAVVIGAAVFVDDVTGEAVDSGDDTAAATGAIYASGTLTGVYKDGTTCSVALVDMPGGL